MNKVLKSGEHQITSNYGTRILNGIEGFHQGVDLVKKGYGIDTIVALEKGTVVATRIGQPDKTSSAGYGNYVKIDHGNGIETLYAHLSEVYVTVGDIVEKNQDIGYMGQTGNSTGIHLHFEVRINGKQVEPFEYIEKGLNLTEFIEYYTIAKGDTLTKIAKKFNTTVNKIMEMNTFITNKNKIFEGDVISIDSSYVEDEAFKVGDKVNLIEYVNSEGLKLKNYDPFYYITEISDTTAVLSAERKGIFYVWAKVKIDNLVKEN